MFTKQNLNGSISNNLTISENNYNEKTGLYRLEPLKIEFRKVFFAIPLSFFLGIIAGACCVLACTN